MMSNKNEVSTKETSFQEERNAQLIVKKVKILNHILAKLLSELKEYWE